MTIVKALRLYIYSGWLDLRRWVWCLSSEVSNCPSRSTYIQKTKRTQPTYVLFYNYCNILYIQYVYTYIINA